MRKLFYFVCIVLFISTPLHSFAWGKKGHQIVGEIAEHFLDDSTKQRVQRYLGNLDFQEAATWMDDVRSNEYYDYMRTWHYVNMEKGQNFSQAAARNAVSIIHAAITELRNKNNLPKDKIKTDLLLIFHLMGDIHQPMHIGYASDRGGNSVNVSYMFKPYKTNLHSVWDTEIIESEKITADTCIQLYANLTQAELNKINSTSELEWMRESRRYLTDAYEFKNDFLDTNYIAKNKSIIENRLLVAGIRLANVLKVLFNS